MKGFTKLHKNRGAHNWLMYECYERFLLENKELLGDVVYDLGAGDSYYKEFFLSRAREYIAVDWSSSCHEVSAEIVADLNGPLPIMSDVADTVVSLSVMEHLREPRVMLAEAFRILKPGGTVIAQVPWQWWVHEAPFDYYRYSPHGLAYLFGLAGFHNITIQPQAGYFTASALKFNYFSRRFVRGPRPLKWLVKMIFVPFWYTGQILAPLLDKLDADWALETPSFFVTAQKP